MITVHKYPLQMSELFSIEAPASAEFLHIDVQGNQLFVWARVDTDDWMRSYDFGVFGTGHDMNESDREGFRHHNPMAHAPHIGTFNTMNGALVFHVFGGIYSAKTPAQ